MFKGIECVDISPDIHNLIDKIVNNIKKYNNLQ